MPQESYEFYQKMQRVECEKIRIRREMNRIQNHPDIKAYIRKRELSLSLYTFKENYSDLKRYLDANNDVDYHLQFDYCRTLRWEYHPLQQEIYRLLLNFTSSAIALVEHTRNTVKRVYSSSDFSREYQNKIDKDLRRSPLVGFVQDLRSCIFHDKFPFVGVHFKHDRISNSPDRENLFGSEIRLFFGKESLLNTSRDWSRLSREYIESQGKFIFIDQFVDDYYFLIHDFHSWLETRQREMHELNYSRLLDEWDELYKELGRLLTEVGSDLKDH